MQCQLDFNRVTCHRWRKYAATTGFNTQQRPYFPRCCWINHASVGDGRRRRSWHNVADALRLACHYPACGCDALDIELHLHDVNVGGTQNIAALNSYIAVALKVKAPRHQ